MREYALVKSTIIMKDVPLLMIILQHLLEHLHSLRCDSRPTSRGNGTGWQGRSWEERIERRLVGHPSAEAGVSDASIDQFYTLSIMYHDAAQFESDMSLGQYACSFETGRRDTEIDISLIATFYIPFSQWQYLASSQNLESCQNNKIIKWLSGTFKLQLLRISSGSPISHPSTPPDDASPGTDNPV